MNKQMITIFGNYGSDVDGFDSENKKHAVRTRINKRPIDIMRDIYANFVAMKADTVLVLKAFGDHLPMLSKITKALKNCGVSTGIECYYDETGLIVVEVSINDQIPIKFIQPEALRLVKGDDAKYALEAPVAPGKDE